MSEITEQQIKTEQLGHLGLVAATIKKLGLVDKINHKLPLDVAKGGKVSNGHRVAAMILNGLGYVNRTLYLSHHFFEDKPINWLLGIDITADDLNDDMLGRALDKIADYGTTSLFSEIVFDICKEQNLLGKGYHLDTTTLSLYGDYDNYADCSPCPLHGYSKDHRPDLKQITLSLTQISEANLPIWFEALDGNVSDKKSFQETVRRIQDFQKALTKAPSQLFFIADAAFYTPKKLAELDSVKWITRVPATHKEAKELLLKPIEEHAWQQLAPGYKGVEVESNVAGIKQRWLLVDSEKARARAQSSFTAQLEKVTQKQKKAIWHLSNEIFLCEADATKALKKFSKQLKYHQLQNVEIVPVLTHSGKGRPKKDSVPACSGYRIKAELCLDPEKINRHEERCGRFILATNELDDTTLSQAQMLAEYKGQTYIESGFGFLKNDEFELNHIYLKNPNRIGALLMVMTLCLVVYRFAEYQLRKSLANNNTMLPNQLGKPTETPTLRWIFQLLSTVSVVCIYDESSGQWVKKITNLKKLHKMILYHFGETGLAAYGLPQTMTMPDIPIKAQPLHRWLRLE